MAQYSYLFTVESDLEVCLSVPLAYHSKLNDTVRCYWFTVQVDTESVSLSLSLLLTFLNSVAQDAVTCSLSDVTSKSVSLSLLLTFLKSVAQDIVICSLSEVTSKSVSLSLSLFLTHPSKLSGTGHCYLFIVRGDLKVWLSLQQVRQIRATDWDWHCAAH